MHPRRPYLLRLEFRFDALDDLEARQRVRGVVEQAEHGIGVRDARLAVKLRELPERRPPRAVGVRAGA